MKRVLMIAFHYPPYAGGTGVHRTLKFTRYLPEYGWQPLVLTASPRAYPRTDYTTEVPRGVTVARAFALDSARHLSIAGRHFQFTAVPDRWVTWWPTAVARGMSLIREHRPHAIWSTYPIATAHAIALALRRLSGLPWVADFRDPMAGAERFDGPSEAAESLTDKVRALIERRVVTRCTRAVFTTSGTRVLYANRFPHARQDLWTVIANGYDEEDFEETPVLTTVDARHKPFVLVHSGDLYRGHDSGRDPVPLLEALAALLAAGKVGPHTLRVVFRATSDDIHYRDLVRIFGLEQMVFIEPPIPHRAAVTEMLHAHGLLLLQGKKFNRQIPAKVYEYLRSGRPIFAVTDPAGDTAALLRAEGVNTQAFPDSISDIATRLMGFINSVNAAPVQAAQIATHHSRRARTQELSKLLDSVVDR